jgi:hypothetical protein
MSQGLKSLVFMDTETATLRGAPFLLELGAVRVVDGDALETFQELVLPPVPIDPDATLVHGIDEAQVRQADFAPAVIERFREFVGDDWMVAHNASFDARVLLGVASRPPRGPFSTLCPWQGGTCPRLPITSCGRSVSISNSNPDATTGPWTMQFGAGGYFRPARKMLKTTTRPGPRQNSWGVCQSL